MATILCYTSPALGNLYPMCALLCELRARGHRVAIRTLARGMPTCQQLDFDTATIDSRIEAIEMTDWMASSGREALKVAFGVFGRRAPLEVEDLAAAIDAEVPDALIIDPNCWGAAVGAEASGLPWAAFWPYTPFLREPGTPPYGPGLPPWPGLVGRIRDELLRPVLTGVVDRALVRGVKDSRIALGLPRVRSADEFIRRAPLMLVASAEPFQYPRSGDRGVIHMIGPCEFDPPAVDGAAWLDDITRPIILVATSSERQDDAGLGLTAITALADEPVHVVATFPAGVPDDIALPPNATAVEFVPHGMVLRKAVCAITHGGMGVTQKALSRGVPVCAVPYGRDQFEVARRVEVSCCGTRLPAGKLTTERLKSKALQAMSMTGGARRVAEGFAAAGGVSRGADLVESRLLARK